MKAGIDPKRDFKTVIFTGAHDANALAVANGKVDAATIADRILDAAIAKGHIKADRSRSCGAPTRSPNRRWCGARTSRPRLKAKVKAAFLAIKDLNWSDQGKLNGFKETNDQAYDVVRETAKLAQHRPQEAEVGGMIEIRGLAKSYGDHQALQGRRPVDPARRVRRRAGPVGRRQVDAAALHQPPDRADGRRDRGRRHVASSERRDLRLLRRNVAMIFQQHNLVKRLAC